MYFQASLHFVGKSHNRERAMREGVKRGTISFFEGNRPSSPRARRSNIGGMPGDEARGQHELN